MEGTNQKREKQSESLQCGIKGSGTSSNENGTGPTWDADAEHYHMLSYFMGGDPAAHHGMIHGSGDGLVTTTTAASAGGATTQPTSSSGGLGAALHQQNGGGSNSSSSASLNEPPPTPAVQFYSHHRPPPTGGVLSSSAPTFSTGGANNSPGLSAASGRAPPLTASSSSSSLSSMAATLVTGGPVVHSMFGGTSNNSGTRKESPLSPSMMRISPISPAAIIGPGQENLMLPPPRRAPKGGGTTAGGTATAETVSSLPQKQQQALHPAHDPEQKQRHMAWLQHINSMAKSAVGQTQPQALQPPPTLTNAIPGYPPAGTAAQLQPVPISMTGSPMASYAQAAAPIATASGTSPPVMGETEERRARRLKRNRESARQSRRRKKEHLLKLEEKVQGLHVAIETERRKQIADMEPQLVLLWRQEIDKMENDSSNQQEKLEFMLEQYSPNSSVRRGALSFQYSMLKQLLLPKYQEFLLWLTLHPDSFFLAGKEERSKKATASQTTRVSSSRVSSKQIGEELSNEFKKKGKKRLSEKGSSKKSGNGNNSPTPDNNNKGYLTSQALDAPRMWPLLCYELSVSVDQEERMLQAQKKTRQLPKLPNDRSQMAMATRMSSNMRNGVLYQAHTADHRRRSSLSHTLTPQQSVVFLRWFAANQDRCRAVLEKQKGSSSSTTEPNVKTGEKQQQDGGKEPSLSEVCLKLESVLRIPKTEETIKEQVESSS